MAGLQRILLSDELEVMPPPAQPATASSQGQKTQPSPPPPQTQRVQLPPAWALATVLRRVIFPLMTMLLNPLAGGKEAANETRVRVCSLATKFVLQHLTALSKYPDFLHLWQEVLAYLEQYMAYATSRHTASDLLCEALLELIKNLILVMMSTGLLSLESERGKEIWKITQPHLARINPRLTEDLYKRLEAAASKKQAPQDEEKKGDRQTSQDNTAQQTTTTVDVSQPPQTNEMK